MTRTEDVALVAGPHCGLEYALEVGEGVVTIDVPELDAEGLLPPGAVWSRYERMDETEPLFYFMCAFRDDPDDQHHP